MKKNILLMFIIFITFHIALYAQPLKWTYESPIDVNYEDAHRFEGIIRGKIFRAHPELEDKYETDLEKKVFLESKEGQELKGHLITEKDSLLKRSYSLYLSPEGWGDRFWLSEYDVEKQAFVFWVGKSFNYNNWKSEYGEQERNEMYEIHHFWYPSLPIKTFSGFLHIQRGIKITIPENKAIEIEKIRENVRVKILFKLRSYTKAVPDILFGGTFYFPIAKRVTIQLINKSTGDVLYEKSYSDPE